MSFSRQVYWYAVSCGWAALIAWLIAELALTQTLGITTVAGVAGMSAAIGAGIGVGLCIVSGIANGHVTETLRRCLAGAVLGGMGGMLGGVSGDAVFAIGLPRALGFMLLGIGVGLADGLYERSFRKIRNGVMGGLIGGLAGGILFRPLSLVAASDSGMSSRAVAFVVLAIVVGASIGMVQILLREAWLTVVDGYRPGRQLILSGPVTTLGRGDHLPLPLLGPGNAHIESEHARLIRQPDGRFRLEDNNSHLGVLVNHRRVSNHLLEDNDLIKLGSNLIRFNERRRRTAPREGDPIAKMKTLPSPPPPPPPKKSVTAPTKPGTANSLKQAGSAPPPPSAPKPPPPPPPPRKIP